MPVSPRKRFASVVRSISQRFAVAAKFVRFWDLRSLIAASIRALWSILSRVEGKSSNVEKVGITREWESRGDLR
jgi:hypothetical protein